MMLRLARLVPLAALLALPLFPHPAVAEENASAAKAPPPIMIANLTEPNDPIYAYGSWSNNFLAAPKAGLRVLGNKGAQGDGGLIHSLDQPLDLSTCVYIEVALATQSGNEVPAYNVVLADDDGTVAAARLHVAQIMPGQAVWLRVKTTDFIVSARKEDQGKDSKLDWTKIAKWHLQGDWATKQPAQILFIAIRARS